MMKMHDGTIQHNLNGHLVTFIHTKCDSSRSVYRSKSGRYCLKLGQGGLGYATWETKVVERAIAAGVDEFFPVIYEQGEIVEFPSGRKAEEFWQISDWIVGTLGSEVKKKWLHDNDLACDSDWYRWAPYQSFRKIMREMGVTDMHPKNWIWSKALDHPVAVDFESYDF